MPEALNPEALRREFPALSQEVSGHRLAYLDNASTTQKPVAVADAVREMYLSDCANIHRGVHTLSQRATERYESVRDRVAQFLGGVDREEVIFVRGTTEAINLVAATCGAQRVERGDEIVVSQLEHHSNLVPWQMLAQQRSAHLRVLPIDDRGCLRLDELPRLLGPRTRIVAVTHVSNSLGSITDVAQVSRAAHEVGAVVVVDGAQAAPHLRVDVSELGADFYAFSGHKVYGPTGAGVLWGRRALLEAMPPWQGGGEMIASVSFEDGTEFAEVPHRFEAGTPDIAAVVGLGAAIDWVSSIGLGPLREHESALLEAATSELSLVDGVRLVGTSSPKGPVLSFVIEGVHPHDAGTVLDTFGVAVRSGHHCTEPVMDYFKLPATIRASFAAYNTLEEVDRLVEGVTKARDLLRRGP